jgi:UDP-N-acetyl-D-glucosamine dehydrogenase
MRSVPLSEDTLRQYDAVLIATDHTAVDYELILRHGKLIVDARGVYREPHPNIVKA